MASANSYRLRVQPRTATQALHRPAAGLTGLVGLMGLLWLLAAWLAAGAAHAATVPGELPALVGRLSAVQGEVRWLDRDGGGWLGSTPGQPLRNWPVATGDRLRTGAGARAELRLGSTTVRLGANAELWLTRLDERALVLHLQAGTAALRLAEFDGDGFGPVEVTTAEGRWLPLRPGSYRLDRDADATQATTWRGELRFEGRDSALTIPAGRRSDLWLNPPGSFAPGQTRFSWAGIERDAFADWVARDERLDDAPITARHVPPGVTGWQDLDRHGDWVTDPGLGALWQPRVVAPGWAPYQDGRWAWVAPWGWTWIDAAPWGFAPFHYGSWVTFQGRWCWSPGPRGQQARYTPVHPAWVSGPAVNIGIQISGRPPPPQVVVPVVVYRPAPPVVVVVNPQPVVIIPPPRRYEAEPWRPPHATAPRGGDREHWNERNERHEWSDRHQRAVQPDPRDSDRRGDNPRADTRRDTRRDADHRAKEQAGPQPQLMAPPAVAAQAVVVAPAAVAQAVAVAPAVVVAVPVPRPTHGSPMGPAAPARPLAPAMVPVSAAPPVAAVPAPPPAAVVAPVARPSRDGDAPRDNRNPREPHDNRGPHSAREDTRGQVLVQRFERPESALAR